MMSIDKQSSFYDVVVHYKGDIPSYVGRVVAADVEQAKRLGYYDATNKGWPRDYVSIEATQLAD